jgi:hypothetical protein
MSKHLKFRPVRRWSNGDKFKPGSVGRGLARVMRRLNYWRRVGQYGSFYKRWRPKKPAEV